MSFFIRCLHCAGETFSALARIILFITGLIYTIFAIGLIVALKYLNDHNVVYQEQVKTGTNLRVILLVLLMIVIGAYAVYCAVSYKLERLQGFFILCFVLLIGGSINLGIDSAELARRNGHDPKSIMQRYKDYMPLYDPTHLIKQENIKTATDSWDDLQRDMICCGLESPDDWHKNSVFNLTGTLPPSCCPKFSGKDHYSVLDICSKNDGYSNMGCYWSFIAVPITVLVVLDAATVVWNIVSLTFACIYMFCKPQDVLL